MSVITAWYIQSGGCECMKNRSHSWVVRSVTAASASHLSWISLISMYVSSPYQPMG